MAIVFDAAQGSGPIFANTRTWAHVVGANEGLGFLINIGRGQYDTALVFVAIFTLVAMALALYGLVVLVESRLLSWQQRPGESR